MATNARWLPTILIVIALVAGTWYFTDGLRRAMRAGAQATVLQREINALKQNIAQARDEQPRIAAWRETAALVRRAGLEPEQWRTYPVAIARDLAWEDVAGVILIASNALPRPGDYWFQPATLRVVRASQDAAPEHAATPPQNTGPGSDRYDLHFQGHFLIQERNQP